VLIGVEGGRIVCKRDTTRCWEGGKVYGGRVGCKGTEVGCGKRRAWGDRVGE
jgi:hypothetical protein